MSNKLKELRTQRGQLVATMRGLLDKAETENRDLTAEEQIQYDQLLADQESTRVTIEREERQAELDRQMAAAARDAGQGSDEPAGAGSEKRNLRDTDEYRAAFNKFLRGGLGAVNADEQRALQVGSDTIGGYVVPSEQFVNQLLKTVDDMVHVRARATKFSVPSAQSLGVPSLDADPADAAWTSELATGNEDSTMAFGKRALHPHPLAKRIKISNDLLRSAVINAEQLVRDRLAYKFGITEEKAFLTGSGAQQPLGLFTASTNGISTARDVSTGNTTTAITFDGLIEAKYALKPQYWPGAEWLFHRDALKQLSKIKDGEGQYIWREGVREGEADRLLGRPFVMSEHVPNTFTTGLYVGMFANFSYYWIADALDLQIQRLVELYAESNQTALIGRLAVDGLPVMEEPFVRVKLA